MTTSKQPKRVYQLKVTLKGTRPPVWRRFLVSRDVSLHRLHKILQIVMGWEDCHLYQFRIGSVEFSLPDPYDVFDTDVNNAKRYKLAQLVKSEKAKFTYLYDFGDYWQHEILVESIGPEVEWAGHPVCLAGKRACPPEDSGGAWRYQELLKIAKDPSDEEYKDTMEWLGEDFDPEEFDLDEVNAALRKIK